MAPSLCQSCLAAETRSAADASHLLLAGLPPLAIFGLALVTAFAFLVLLDPGPEQRIPEQRLEPPADLEEAVKKLRAGIAGLNKEGRERLLTAFEQVNANFSTLFTHLFGGGEARLVLVESDDPLEAGLEILCQPPGK